MGGQRTSSFGWLYGNSQGPCFFPYSWLKKSTLAADWYTLSYSTTDGKRRLIFTAASCYDHAIIDISIDRPRKQLILIAETGLFWGWNFSRHSEMTLHGRPVKNMTLYQVRTCGATNPWVAVWDYKENCVLKLKILVKYLWAACVDMWTIHVRAIKH